MILSASDNASNGMMMVLLVLCATTIMIMLLRRHQFRGVTGRDMARDHLARIRDQHKLRESMDQLLVELEEVSRRVGAQVDTKFVKLETVIRDADDRIARLEDLLAGLERRGRSASPAHRRDERSRPAAPTAKEPTAATPARQATNKNDGAGSTPTGHPPAEPTDSRFRRVYELVDAGASPIKAAEQLGMPLGEVELILNLRRLR